MCSRPLTRGPSLFMQSRLLNTLFLLISMQLQGLTVPTMFSLGSINARNSRGGLAKDCSVQVPKGFSVRVFKGPALSNYQYAATPKFDLGYRSHPPSNSSVWPLPETKAKPSQSDLPDRSSGFLGSATPQNRHTYELEGSVPPPNYSIYPSAAKDIYIYERSLCSKSDTYTESDVTSETTESPSSCFSTALSNDSTATLQSTAPTPSLVSDSTAEPSPPVAPPARAPFPFQISPVDYTFSTPGNGHTEGALSVPMVRSLTADPIIRLPVSSMDESSASTEISGPHSSTLTYSSYPSNTREDSSSGGPRFSPPNVPPQQNTQANREPNINGIFPASQSRQPGSGGNYHPYYTTPSPPHKTRPSSGHFSSSHDKYSTSATRGYSPPHETLQNVHESRTGFFPSLPEPRYPDGYTAIPPRVDPVSSGGHDAYTLATSRGFGHRGDSSPTTHVRRGEENRDSLNGVNPSARNPIEYRPETPYLPSGRQLNDIRVRSPTPRDAGETCIPTMTLADTFPDSMTRGQTEKPDRSQQSSRMRQSVSRQNSRALPTPPRARGESISMAGERDALDLAERGESSTTQGKRDSRHGDSFTLGEATAVTSEYRGGFPRQPTRRDSDVKQSFKGPQASPTSLTVDHRFPTGHISSREDALNVEATEPYPSTTSRGFTHGAEPLPTRRDLNDRDPSFRAHPQQTRNYVDYELVPHCHARWDSGERQDSGVSSAPPAAPSGTKPLISRRGEANNTASRDMYASTPRALTSRQENLQGMQSLQDVNSRHNVAGPQVSRNDVKYNAVPSRGSPRRDSDERQAFPVNPTPSHNRATYLNDTGADTDINRQPPPSQNKSRSVPPLRDISSVQHNPHLALQASGPQRISEGHRSAPAGTRCVRWDKDLIAPSPITPSQRRKGWFNRRGDQLWTNDGLYKPPPVGHEFPLDLDSYPEYGQGWQNEEGVRIDMRHRLIPKVPLRSALKRPRVQGPAFDKFFSIET